MSNTTQEKRTVVCDLSVADDESYCIGGHFVHNCRSTLTPILFDEEPQWNDAEPNKQEKPLEGFGAIDEGLLPENSTAQTKPKPQRTEPKRAASLVKAGAKPKTSTATKPAIEPTASTRIEVPRLDTVDDYRQWLSENHPHVQLVEGSQVDVKALRPTLSALLDESRRLPGMYSKDNPLVVAFAPDEEKRAVACIMRQVDLLGDGVKRDVMSFNSRLYSSHKRLTDTLASNHQAGFTAGKGVAHPARHEYGHAVRTRLESLHPEKLKRWQSSIDASKLSDYATESDDEAFAEAYALLRDHDTKVALGMKQAKLAPDVENLRGLLKLVGY